MSLAKIQYDRRVRPFEYNIDDLVLIENNQVRVGKKKKLLKRSNGPYRIIEKINDHIYKIKPCYSNKRSKIINKSKMRKFFGQLNNERQDTLSNTLNSTMQTNSNDQNPLIELLPNESNHHTILNDMDNLLYTSIHTTTNQTNNVDQKISHDSNKAPIDQNIEVSRPSNLRQKARINYKTTRQYNKRA